MFKKVTIEERSGVKCQVTREWRFVTDTGQFYPLGFRTEAVVVLPEPARHMAALAKTFGRAYTKRKVVGGREYLEARPGEWVDVTAFDFDPDTPDTPPEPPENITFK